MHYKLLSVLTTQWVMWVLLFLMLFPQQWLLAEMAWIFFSVLFLLYLPWYWIGYVFFHYTSLNALERFIMNFLISSTLTILIAYYLYYTNIQLSSIMIYLITFVILFIAIVAVLIRRRKNPLDQDLIDQSE